MKKQENRETRPIHTKRTSPEKLRVLHVIDHLGRGGPPQSLLQVAKRLTRDGWDLAVCSLRSPRERYDEFAQAGIPIWYLSRKRWDPSQFFDLVRLMQRERFDIVHTQAEASAIVGTLAARIARVPHVVVHDHSGDYFRGDLREGDTIHPIARRIYTAVDRRIQRWVDRVVVVSESVANYRRSRDRATEDRVRVIPNGVDLSTIQAHENARTEVREELGIPESALVVGAAGRFVIQKGHKVLIEAMAKATRTPPDTVLLLVGDGPLRGALGAQAATLGISDRLRITG